MNNYAVERFLSEHYDNNNILIVDIMEKCDFNPKIDEEHCYNAKVFYKKEFNSVRGFYSYPPVDEVIIRELSQYEGSIIKMMDGYFPLVEAYEERKRIYYDALRLFNGIICANNIDCFIEFGIPHEIFSYIIYCICKVRGIKTICTYRLTSLRYSYYLYDINDHFLGHNESSGATLDDLNDDFRLDYKKYTQQNGNVGLYYMHDTSIRSRMEVFRKRFRQFRRYENKAEITRDVIKGAIRKRRINRTINRIAGEVDYTAKYIYFPLQYQPEGTTSPMGGVYVSQELIIQMLSFCVPDDVFVYIKAHPNANYRGPIDGEWWERISKLRNVIVVPTGVSTKELEDNCIACTTCTGTVAYECLYKRKPSLLFGQFVYNAMPGAYSIKSTEDCKNAIESILNGVKIGDQEIIDYLFRLQGMAYHTDISLEIAPMLIEQGVSYKDMNAANFSLLTDAFEGCR